METHSYIYCVVDSDFDFMKKVEMLARWHFDSEKGIL